MTNFKISKINTVIVQVKNLEKSIQFYEHVLQLHKGFVDQSMAYFSFGPNEDQAEILLHTVDQPEPVEKGMVIELLVNDVEIAVSSIRQTGYEIVQEPIDREWGVKEAVIVDPDGYHIWLAQPLQ